MIASDNSALGTLGGGQRAGQNNDYSGDGAGWVAREGVGGRKGSEVKVHVDRIGDGGRYMLVLWGRATIIGADIYFVYL